MTEEYRGPPAGKATRAVLCFRARLAAVLLLIAAAAAAPRPGVAQNEADAVPAGEVADDLFAAGGSVHVTASIGGDLFVAGGWVDVQSEVADNLLAAGGVMNLGGAAEGDLIAAGGIVDVAARVGDNLVATGAMVSVEGPVGGKLFTAAGRLRLGRNARIADGAWLAAGSADVGGAIGGATTVAAGRVVLRGRIAGDVEVTALSLEIADGAVIDGRLVYYGPDPPDIREGAQIAGGVDHRYEPKGGAAAETEVAGWPPVFWLVVTLGLGLILHLLVPRYLESAGRRAMRQPIASFGLGLAILFVTPVMIVLLIVSVLGFAVGIAAIAAYGTLLLLGPVVTLFGVVDRLRARALVATPARRRVAFVLALLALTLLSWLPYVGTPLFWSAMVLGLGAATWQLYDSIRAEPAPVS